MITDAQIQQFHDDGYFLTDVVFDAATIRDTATYDTPCVAAEGVCAAIRAGAEPMAAIVGARVVYEGWLKVVRLTLKTRSGAHNATSTGHNVPIEWSIRLSRAARTSQMSPGIR